MSLERPPSVESWRLEFFTDKFQGNELAVRILTGMVDNFNNLQEIRDKGHASAGHATSVDFHDLI